MTKEMLLVLILSIICPPFYCNPAPPGKEVYAQAPDEVKELQNLRTENRQPNATKFEPSGDLRNESNEGGANSRSAIFRHRVQAKRNRNWNAQQPQNDKGIPYTPRDLATYVMNTGDEEGVAVAVEELVREGRMGRTDAINYLQDVKQILTYMRDQYDQSKKMEELRMKEQFDQNKKMEELRMREQFEQNKKMEELRNNVYPKMQLTQKFSSPVREEPKPNEMTTEHSHQAVSEPPLADVKTPPTDAFTLDVIYKLAKDMFIQSILRDDPTAEETLSGLVTFLEREVGNQRISPALKEKILEVVSAALVDSLREARFDEVGLANRPSKASMLGYKGSDNMLQLPSTSDNTKSS